MWRPVTLHPLLGSMSGGSDIQRTEEFPPITAAALPNSGVVAATYGSATHVPVIAVDAKGRITSASNVAVAPPFASITGKPTTLAGYGIADGATQAYANAAAAAAKTGSAVLLAQIGSPGGETWFAGDFLGPDGVASVDGSDIIPWIAPCPGVLKMVSVESNVATGGVTTITVHRSPAGLPVAYAATALVPSVASGASGATDSTNSIVCAARDRVLCVPSAHWLTSGLQVKAQFIPTSP